MDQRNYPEELSKRTGFLVRESMELEHMNDPDWVYYTVSSEKHNAWFLIRYSRYIRDDPVFDLAEDLKVEMDRFANVLKKRRAR